MSHHVVDRVVAETIAVEIIAIIETIAMMIATIETIEITIVEIKIVMIRIIIRTIRQKDLRRVAVDQTAVEGGPMGTADVDVVDKGQRSIFEPIKSYASQEDLKLSIEIHES